MPKNKTNCDRVRELIGLTCQFTYWDGQKDVTTTDILIGVTGRTAQFRTIDVWIPDIRSIKQKPE